LRFKDDEMTTMLFNVGDSDTICGLMYKGDDIYMNMPQSQSGRIAIEIEDRLTVTISYDGRK